MGVLGSGKRRWYEMFRFDFRHVGCIWDVGCIWEVGKWDLRCDVGEYESDNLQG